MKKLVFVFILLTALKGSAQVANVPTVAPAPYSPLNMSTDLPYLHDLSNTALRNFVRTYQPQQPSTNPLQVEDLMAQPAANTVPFSIKSTKYLDGLGRPLQDVIRMGLKTATEYRDLVQPHVYDANGREAVQYKPYSVSASTVAVFNGFLQTSPQTQLYTFYNNLYQGEHPYAKKSMTVLL